MTPAHHFELAPGLLVEDLGSECVVFVPGKTDVITLSGEAAHTLRAIQAGTPVSDTTPHLAHLVDLGILHTSTTMSRRGVVRAGMIGAGAGIAALAMPSVAAASSPSSGGGGGGQRIFVVNASVPSAGGISVIGFWGFGPPAPWDLGTPSAITLPDNRQISWFENRGNNGDWTDTTFDPFPSGFPISASFTVGLETFPVRIDDGRG